MSPFSPADNPLFFRVYIFNDGSVACQPPAWGFDCTLAPPGCPLPLVALPQPKRHDELVCVPMFLPSYASNVLQAYMEKLQELHFTFCAYKCSLTGLCGLLVHV